MHILLKKTKDYKGILIVTHKESPYWEKYLTELKDSYYILIHNGSANNPMFPRYLTYNLIADSRCFNEKCLPFTTRNFLDKTFNNNFNIVEVNKKLQSIIENNKFDFEIKDFNSKQFDFIGVTRFSDYKKPLEQIKFMKTCGSEFKYCLIILSVDGHDNELLRQEINKLLPIKNLLYIDTKNIKSNNQTFKGFNSSELSVFYQTSKVYMHTCEAEGESRTIHEALCCGCKILAKENMFGGGLDYLNLSNSILYNKENVYKKMLEIIKSIENYKLDPQLFKRLSETHSIQDLLSILYNNLNYENYFSSFEEFINISDTNKLQFKLPAHYLDVPWYLKEKPTADILTDKQLDIFNKFYNIT